MLVMRTPQAVHKVTQRILIALLPTILLALIGELSARVYYYHVHRDTRYLIAPFGGARITGPPPEYPMTRGTYVKVDPCSGKTITYHVNAQEGRGQDWAIAKPKGTIRILAVGGSTTFGQNNPEEATWPAFLERILRRRYHLSVEVLNGGQPGMRLERTLAWLSKQWLQYQPDLVMYYEAYNNTPYTQFKQTDLAISHFHQDSWFGRLAYHLYYRSLLYTYLLEKLQFTISQHRRVTPELKHFQTLLNQMIQVLRQRGITPALVLQATKFEEAPKVRSLSLTNDHEIQEFILEEAQAKHRVTRDQLTAMRIYGVQVFVEAIRRVGEVAGVQVIDPRPAFAAYHGREPLFCDEVHLTDTANKLLAQEIADHLDLSRLMKTSTPSERQEIQGQ